MAKFDRILNIFFPKRCLFCRTITEQTVCHACTETYILKEPACKRGKYFERCIAPMRYHGAVRNALLRFKFSGERSCAESFAVWMAKAVRDHYADMFDVVTWVPVSPERLHERGYDQAEILADALCRQLHIGKAVRLLHRTISGKRQSHTNSAAERARNIRESFSVDPHIPVAGLRVLIVDDIITTGNTLEECACTLRENGAVCVLCVCVATSR